MSQAIKIFISILVSAIYLELNAQQDPILSILNLHDNIKQWKEESPQNIEISYNAVSSTEEPVDTTIVINEEEKKFTISYRSNNFFNSKTRETLYEVYDRENKKTNTNRDSFDSANGKIVMSEKKYYGGEFEESLNKFQTFHYNDPNANFKVLGSNCRTCEINEEAYLKVDSDNYISDLKLKNAMGTFLLKKENIDVQKVKYLLSFDLSDEMKIAFGELMGKDETSKTELYYIHSKTSNTNISNLEKFVYDPKKKKYKKVQEFTIHKMTLLLGTKTFDAEGALSEHIQYEYNDNNQQVAKIDMLTNKKANTIYNPNGKIVEENDLYGSKTLYSYNDKAQLILMATYNSDNELQSFTKYTY